MSCNWNTSMSLDPAPENETLGPGQPFECGCVWKYPTAVEMAKTCNNSSCKPFCTDFKHSIPYVYLACSTLSAFCCVLVFITYRCIPRLRQTGYSSKVFLSRTVMDFVIAIGHIVAGISNWAGHGLAESESEGTQTACAVLGSVNELALVASNLWYVLLAVDLIRAIRNPFSSQPVYSWFSQLIVLLCSAMFAAVLGLLHLRKVGPGTSMFYWCWVGVKQDDSSDKFRHFVLVSLGLYYLWHVIFWVFSLLVTIVAGCILWGHLAASSETRKFVLRQNLYYVLVLGVETFFIIVLWLIQVSLIQHFYSDTAPYFFTHTDLVLAGLYAFVHSMRGAVDLFVWAWTFAIGPLDFTDCYRRHRIKFSTRKKLHQVPRPDTLGHSLSTPLLSAVGTKDNLVNRALRRNAIYCINVGILDAVHLDIERNRSNNRLGSVRESFVAARMVEVDQANQRDELGILYDNPAYSDQCVRKIKFPASSSHLKEFSFIDLEPRIFSLLRETYGISPRTYRKSFEIKNAADIDSSPMLEKFTEGKSGSFFYFTRDYRFMVKTVKKSEEKFLCKIAYDYYRYMRDNEDSLLTRFFGLHKVRLAPEQRYITVVVMENIFPTPNSIKLHRKFDLKGSWVGRRSLRTGQHVDRYKGTLKDLDLGEEKILVGVEAKEQLMEQLRRDVEFLTKCEIMDYSLLLGIHEEGVESPVSPGKAATAKVVDGGFTDVSTGPIKPPPEAASASSSSSSSSRKAWMTSSRHGTITSNYGNDDDLHVPWFRQDGGGLHSCSKWSFPFSDLDESDPRASVAQRDSVVNVGNPPVTYFFGVIDILQEYSLRKKLEHLFKTRVLRQDRHGISAVNESEYGERFLKFLDSIIE